MYRRSVTCRLMVEKCLLQNGFRVLRGCYFPPGEHASVTRTLHELMLFMADIRLKQAACESAEDSEGLNVHFALQLKSEKAFISRKEVEQDRRDEKKQAASLNSDAQCRSTQCYAGESIIACRSALW